jgi:hypothetical protein
MTEACGRIYVTALATDSVAPLRRIRKGTILSARGRESSGISISEAGKRRD